MSSLKILVVSGNAYARHGLVLTLRASADCVVFSSDSTPQELSRWVNECHPDLVIADLSGSRRDWKTIARLSPTLRVLVITDTVVEFAKANPGWPQDGLIGCAGQPSDALRWVDRFCNESRASKCASLNFTTLKSDLENEDKPDISITPREREIMELVRQGCCNKRIARALSISITTVRTHRYKMMAKLDLHNAVEIARYAERLAAA